MYPTPRTWWRIQREYSDIISLPYKVSLSSFSLLTAPLALWERLRYGGTPTAEPLAAPPLFIVGHWRSGTTFLHRVLAADRQWAIMTAFEAFAPHFYMSTEGWLRPMLEPAVPEDRGIDRVTASLDSSAEDEIAIARLNPYTFSVRWLFPQSSDFARLVFLEGLADEARAEWLRTYDGILRKLSYNKPGKRLLLKNPAHTGRIKLLLDLYPEAQFVHIHRHPYEVYRSMRAYYLDEDKLDGQLEAVPPEAIEQIVIDDYARLMERYLSERDLLRDDQLVEVAFADLEADPLAVAGDIYQKLGLPVKAEGQAQIAQYVASTRNYRKNPHPPLDAATRRRLDDALAHVFAAWY